MYHSDTVLTEAMSVPIPITYRLRRQGEATVRQPRRGLILAVYLDVEDMKRCRKPAVYPCAGRDGPRTLASKRPIIVSYEYPYSMHTNVAIVTIDVVIATILLRVLYK